MRNWPCSMLCTVLIVAAGCYRFEPTTLDAVPLGAKIRTVLSTSARDQLEERHGIVGRQLNATLMSADGDAVSFLVASVPITPELGAGPLYQQIDIPKADVLRVDLRRLDAGKTAVVIGGAAVAFVVVARATFLGGGRGVRPGPPPPPGERRGWLIPLLLGRF